jgi:hypothetical protein
MFRLVNAPTAFQGHIDDVLSEHPDQFCIAYLDNIVVSSNLLNEHREHDLLVLAKLQESGPNLKLSKCIFKMQQISYVSFIVVLEGIEMQLDRVRTIAK